MTIEQAKKTPLERSFGTKMFIIGTKEDCQVINLSGPFWSGNPKEINGQKVLAYRYFMATDYSRDQDSGWIDVEEES